MTKLKSGPKKTSITFRCSYDDCADILSLADAAGLSQSAYIRLAALQHLPGQALSFTKVLQREPELLKMMTFFLSTVLAQGLTNSDPKVTAAMKQESIKIMTLMEKFL